MHDVAVRREIGARLKASRLALRMSQPEVAVAVNRSPQAVSKWELGKSMPAADDWYVLGRLLGVSLDYLVYGIRTIPVSDSPIIGRIFSDSPVRKPPKADA
jgi:transcriptional regulator with XRE-family HTH domain